MNHTKTHEQFMQEFIQSGSNELIIIGTYTKQINPILVKCKKCQQESLMLPTNLLKGKRCSFCYGHAVKKGYNSFGDLHPELLQYFIDQEQAFSHRERSNQKAKLKCPICGAEYERTYDYLYKVGFHCQQCEPLNSIPNRILRYCLLSIPNISELQFEKVFKDNEK